MAVCPMLLGVAFLVPLPSFDALQHVNTRVVHVDQSKNERNAYQIEVEGAGTRPLILFIASMTPPEVEKIGSLQKGMPIQVWYLEKPAFFGNPEVWQIETEGELVRDYAHVYSRYRMVKKAIYGLAVFFGLIAAILFVWKKRDVARSYRM